MELPWKFTVLNDYVRKEQKLKINVINVQLSALKRNKNNLKKYNHIIIMKENRPEQ